MRVFHPNLLRLARAGSGAQKTFFAPDLLAEHPGVRVRIACRPRSSEPIPTWSKLLNLADQMRRIGDCQPTRATDPGLFVPVPEQVSPITLRNAPGVLSRLAPSPLSVYRLFELARWTRHKRPPCAQHRPFRSRASGAGVSMSSRG